MLVAEYWEYDARLCRFLSLDPLTGSYPELSPYQFAGNTPIEATEIDGLEPQHVNRNWTGGDGSHWDRYDKSYTDKGWEQALSDAKKSNLPVAKLLNDKNIYGGVLTTTYDSKTNKLIKSEYTGYKTKNPAIETLKTAENAVLKAAPILKEGNNDGANAGSDARDAVAVGVAGNVNVVTCSAAVSFVPSEGFKELDFKFTGAVDAKIPDAGLSVFIEQYKFSSTLKGNKTEALNGFQHNEGVNVNIFGVSRGVSYVNNNPSEGQAYTSINTSFGLTAGIPSNVSKGQSVTIGGQSMYKYIMENLTPKTPVAPPKSK